jgi:purine/pyrimidine-nucleoside phosphorylase
MFKTNEYFDGKVKSIAFQGKEKPATIGVMAAGDYVFNTAEKEKMSVITGELIIKLKADGDSISYSAGQSFDVDANSSFDVSVPADCAYLCEYG